MLIGILFLLGGAVCLVTGVVFLVVAYIFHRRPELTSKTGADLMEATYKENVTRYGRRGSTLFLRHLTKAIYVFTVRGKDYTVRDEHYGTRKQTPRIIPIVYITKFPCFHYKNDGIADDMHLLFSLVLVTVAGFAIYGGVEILQSILQ